VNERPSAIAEISAASDPLYQQVYSAITDAIRSGRLRPGDRLPTERQFCEQLEVSRATVRRALGQLVEEGIVEAQVGRGSFVRAALDSFAEPANMLMSFTELAAARGLKASAEVISQVTRSAVPEEALAFKVGVHSLVFELRRLRMLDDMPVALDRTRIPLDVAPSLPAQDFTTASIYETLEADGAVPVTADVVVSAEVADEARAAALHVGSGSPLLVCTTMSYDLTGRLVEIGEITYRADLYQLHTKLVRTPTRPAARQRPGALSA
jgi:DNA-binding GntR family transcriptional regulator